MTYDTKRVNKATNAIERFLVGIQFNDFESNEEKIFAVTRAIEIIGEAVKNVPNSVRKEYPHIPWKSIARMRDKLIHEYWGTDIKVIWRTTQEDIPQLKVMISKIVDDLRQKKEP